MSKTIFTELTIMFVDVAGSVALYEKLGDGQAYRLIAQCQQAMAILIEEHRGRVIETIGDEIMCAFEYADDAVDAASVIQNSGQQQQQPLKVRIGLHSGKTGMESEHPYGDTVNVAARMVGLAEAGKIIMTKDAVSRLSTQNCHVIREYDRVFVKGKSQPYDTFEVVWNPEDSTISLPSTEKLDKRAAIYSVRIEYCGRQRRIDESSGTFLIGRDDDADLVVPSKAASRQHASLECRQGSAILTDKSTNGTMLTTNSGRRAEDGLQRFLHRDQCYLLGSGVISLGESIREDDPHLIRFECLLADD